MSINNSLPEGNEHLVSKNLYINLSKLPEGESRFRIVMRPIAGWVDWKDKKPYRFRPDNKPKTSYDPEKPIKPFWALYVWDYAKEGLYIMEITQNSVRQALEMLGKNEEWGDLTSFDFKVKKEGSGLETSYSVIPIPPKPMASVIKDSLATQPVRLEALYDGGNPWTDLVATNVTTTEKPITEQQTARIDTLVKEVNDKNFLKELETHLHVNSIYHVPERDYQRAIRALEERVKAKKPKEAGHEQRRMASVA